MLATTTRPAEAMERGTLARTTPGASVTTASAGVLYAWGVSPYCYKVQLAAAHRGIALDVRIASMPDLMRAKKRTGKRSVPCLAMGERWVTDSTVICEHLEGMGSGPSLLPADPRDRAECRLLEDWSDGPLNDVAEPWIWVGDGQVRFSRIAGLCADEQVHAPTRIIFRVMKGYLRRRWHRGLRESGGLLATQATLGEHLDLIEARLGSRPWLFPDGPSLADFAIAAQLANLVRFGGGPDLEARPATAAMVRRAAAALPWSAS